ncbi:glycosyltransferase family 4 protein [Clavibacter sp. km1a]|uniref:glycosyltransferase family 4 protein n=1 Tax=Clavibacter sp. km1a TaxID=3459136 RepID=UPI004043114D
MRLVFDCRYTRIGRHDGISRYGAELVARLGARFDVTMLISDHRQLALLPDLPWQLVSSPTGPREPWVARRISRLRPDVVYSPMQTMGSRGRTYPLVLTLHDLIYYRHRRPPRDLPAPVRALWRAFHLAWWPQRLLLDRADAIVTVSETTRGLIRRHRLTTRPVVVVPNAAELAPAPDGTPDGPRDAPEERTLVYMGSYMPYKNVETLVRAADDLPEHELQLMSRIAPAERERLEALADGARLVFRDGASDAEYAATLRRATALLTASRDEGFGIPVVEAMSVGLPVVVSDIPIFREIGGDAAVYVDPDDPEGFAAAVRALEDPAEWRRRSAACSARAAEYGWDRSAEVLGDLLEQVARTGRRGA